MLTALETTGTVNENHELVLDEALPDDTPSRVRVIVLFNEDADVLSDRDWLEAASKNDSFDFLSDDTEDIYSLEDGKPFAG